MGRAVVTFEAPHGSDAHVLDDGDVVAFGRDSSCGLRFAHAPVADRGVARTAGRFLVAGARVIVESRSEVGHRALEIRVENGPPVQLAPREAFSPGQDAFEVLVFGEHAWPLRVAVRAEDTIAGHATSAEPATNRVELTLTPAQTRILRAYAAPVLRGHLEPATHGDVAGSLALHANTVREALYEIYARMFAAGIPMPDVGDKRVAVVEAARVHGLVEATG